jgi:CYTH domain-containing protein
MKRNFSIITIFTITTCLVLVACDSATLKLAKTQLKQARKQYEDKNYNQAKSLLDSVIEFSTEDIETQIKAKDLLRTISIEEQQRNLKYLDSMLVVREDALPPLKKNFLEVKEESLPLMFVHTKQLAAQNYMRSYIKASLDSAGNFYIISYYCGGPHINHTRIKAISGNQSAESEDVPFDELDNRHLDDSAHKWEIVKYKEGKDNGVTDFIAQNADKQVKIEFIGKSTASIYLEQYDKEAIRDSYEISLILKEIAQLKTNRENAVKELKRLGAL